MPEGETNDIPDMYNIYIKHPSGKVHKNAQTYIAQHAK